jgi:type II secretory pathway component PulF
MWLIIVSLVIIGFGYLEKIYRVKLRNELRLKLFDQVRRKLGGYEISNILEVVPSSGMPFNRTQMKPSIALTGTFQNHFFLKVELLNSGEDSVKWVEATYIFKYQVIFDII